MKIFRKITTGILALTLCTGMTSINVGAASSTYLKGDVDGDGQVGLVDLAYLRNVTVGSKCSNNDRTTQRYDVNLDGIISNEDVNVLSNIIVGNEPTTLRTYATINRDIESSSSKSYRKVNARTGAITISSYTLNAVNSVPTGESSSNYTMNSSAYIPISWCPTAEVITSTGTFSAFVVDEHTLLTAASNLYNRTTGAYASDIRYRLFDSEGTAIAYTPYAEFYHIPTTYVNSNYTPDIADSNYAIITVSENIGIHGIPDLGIPRKELINKDITLWSSGFVGPGVSLNHGNLCDEKITNSSMYYTMNYTESEVGGPVYVIDSNGNKTIIGINTPVSGHESNAGKRIDTNILNFVFQNSYL